MRRFMVCSMALLLGGPALAQRIEESVAASAELALSNDTLAIRYLDKMEQADDRRLAGEVLLSEERDLVLGAGMMFGADLGRRFDLSVGPQLFAALLNDENQDVMALAFGGEMRFHFDPERRFAVSGRAFYAPDILSFGSADNLTDLSARAEMQISDRVMGFAGMRWFEFDLTDGRGERTLQEEVFVGVRYQL
jgi:hypothetical protein